MFRAGRDYIKMLLVGVTGRVLCTGIYIYTCDDDDACFRYIIFKDQVTLADCILSLFAHKAGVRCSIA